MTRTLSFLEHYHIKALTSISILFYFVLSHSLGRLSGHHRCICNNPFHLVLFSAALVELAKSIPVHSLILSFHLFFCLHFVLCPYTVPCRVAFAKPEDIQMWRNYLSFHVLTRVRNPSYSPMAAWIFLQTSSLETMYKMFTSLW